MIKKMVSAPLSAISVAAIFLAGCVTPETFMQEYKQASGIDVKNEQIGHPCTHSAAAKTPNQFQAANVACARERSGKPYASDSVLSYTEFKGGYESECFFGGYDRTLILDRMSKGVGLVQPVLIYGEDGAVLADWQATERLINLLRTSMKLNVKPVSDTKEYYRVLIAHRAEIPRGGLMGIGQMIEIDKVKNKHYTEVIAKLPAVDYVVTPSQDLVDEILTGSLQAKQEMFKMAANAKNLEIDSKKTFKPNEIRELQAFNQLLEQMIRANSRDIKLGFQLVERMKAYNEKEQTLTSQLVVAGLKRGCSIADLDNRFADKQIVTAEVKSDDKKTVADRLREMVQIDTSRGLEISLSNEQRLRDAFISNRTKLRELNAGFAESMRERYRKVNDQLVPFAARAFDTFKVTGFTRSNKL